MITADRLTKRFGDRTVVDAVTFEVEKGEILGFLGPNAAGKTTTMKMLTCYFPPSSGSARVAGFDVVEESLQVRRNIGFLPENVPLYTEMSVREYLEFAAAAKGVPHVDRKNAVNRALERCNLVEVEEQLIGTISRGYRQRVGLGQAIINEPPVLILDEPTVGLDPAQIRDIRELIKELGRTSTVILSTHILPEVSLTCNRVIIIDRGVIREVDTPENLTAKLQRVNSVRLQVDGPIEEVRSTLRAMQGIENVTLDGEPKGNLATWRVDAARGVEVRGELSRAVVQKGWTLYELHADQLSLEQIFLNVVQREDHEVRAEKGGEAA